MTRVAVVTIAHGRRDHLAAQHRSLAASAIRPDVYVVVAMDDATLEPAPQDDLAARVLHVDRDPLGLPLAAARNRGVAAVLERGADVVVCLDVDCLAGSQLVGAYADVVVSEPGVVWSGPVTYLPPPADGGYPLDGLPDLDDPHPARPAPAPGEVLRDGNPDLFWSLSFATSAEAWQRSGGFCEEYVGYGGEDTDFARTVLDRDLGLAWVGAARAYHQHHEISRPPVEHLDDILRNAAIFHGRWGTWPMEGWLSEFERRGLIARRDGRWQRVDRADGH